MSACFQVRGQPGLLGIWVSGPSLRPFLGHPHYHVAPLLALQSCRGSLFPSISSTWLCLLHSSARPWLSTTTAFGLNTPMRVTQRVHVQPGNSANYFRVSPFKATSHCLPSETNTCPQHEPSLCPQSEERELGEQMVMRGKQGGLGDCVWKYKGEKQ